MATLKEYQSRLTRLTNPKALELTLFIEIKRHEKLFIEAQKRQLERGLDNEGVEIGVYSEATEEISKSQNPIKPKIAGQPYNFQYYGDFFEGFVLNVDGTKAEFYSKDGKTEELIGRYDNLFGLQTDNLREIITGVILPAFLLQIRKELGLNA